MTIFIESVINEYLGECHKSWSAYKEYSYSFICIESDDYRQWMMVTPEEGEILIVGGVTGDAISRYYTPSNMLDVITQCILEVENDPTNK